MDVLVGYRVFVFCAIMMLHAGYSFTRLCSQLHMLQLNSYFLDRYATYCKRSITKLWHIQDFEPLLALLGVWLSSPDLVLIILALAYSKMLLSYQPTVKIKKKLVFTARVWRLLLVSALVWSLGYYYCWHSWAVQSANFLIDTVVLLVGCVLLLPLILAVCNVLLMPIEWTICRYYFCDAKKVLERFDNLKRIGITGSFGKTTTKYILNSLLSSEFITLKTPGSYNTPMGIAKVVRGQLRPIHQIFVAEMSARLPGDIRELCELVKPQYGLITVIGEQHLEYFKSLDRIKRTKYELIEALPPDGVAFFNLDDPNSLELINSTSNVRKVTFSLRDSHADYYLGEVVASAGGSHFKIWVRGELQAPLFTTMLLGKTNLYDIVAAIAVASELGVSLERLAAVMPTVVPVPHRLELRVSADGTVIIDDSYNANPVGSKQALEVLASFTAGRKLIVTPGMIELGAHEDDYNRDFARAMVDVCDYVIIVGKHCRRALLEGLKEMNYPEDKIFVADNFYQARDHLQQMTKAGDVVLFENDFTDDYEGN